MGQYLWFINAKGKLKNEVDVYTHYELLIDEDDDPVYDDDNRLKQYMSNWDGPIFFRCLDMNVENNEMSIQNRKS